MDHEQLPVFFIPHGGGPWPIMKDAFGDPAAYDSLEEWLRDFGLAFGRRARSLLVVSAHWETPVPTVHVGDRPGMLYDYGGFPEAAYRLEWPAPGDPGLAERAASLLGAAGWVVRREEQRGYDHGTFVPLMVAFPGARLPVAQLSILESLDPDEHFRLGQALAPLRSEGVLIVCSGMSYHNLGGFFRGGAQVGAASEAFDAWLREAVKPEDAAARRERLAAWEQAPHARDCHPRSEHLVPLFVAAGAAGDDPANVDWSERLMGARVSAFRFGA